MGKMVKKKVHKNGPKKPKAKMNPKHAQTRSNVKKHESDGESGSEDDTLVSVGKQRKPQKEVQTKESRREKAQLNEKCIQSILNVEKSTNSGENDSDDDDWEADKHKKSLMRLEETDPEFFKYLKQNDTKLLDFNMSDEGSDVDDNEDYDDMRHIPDGNLEVASDESDYTDDDESKKKTGGPIKVTQKLLREWESEIQDLNTKSSLTKLELSKFKSRIKDLVEAFQAALESVNDSEDKTVNYKVEGGAIFNGIVQLCMLQLPQAYEKFLKFNTNSVSQWEAHKAKRFPKIKGILRSYLQNLIKLLNSVSSTNIIATLLKHMHGMIPYTQSFSSLCKPLLRVLLKFWSTGEEETVRVLAFLCISKLALNTKSNEFFNGLMKTMYMKYVENAKFVSPNTLPAINFMRRSLAEIYLLQTEIAYHSAFMYIRQLGIHLRNALTLKKKEHFQIVYNWQYVNSLWFWALLISEVKENSLLKQLLYPLIQIIIGVINLIPTPQYYPLRFHCVRMLLDISRKTDVFIPILPFLLQVLEEYDFNKKHKIVSMKPMSLACMLRVSKSQSSENGYKDAIIENVYELILETAELHSHKVYFPDLMLQCIVKVKAFLKKCHVANYCRKLKQLLDKIEENCKFIVKARGNLTVDLTNTAQIEHWESSVKENETPLSNFYKSWVKVNELQKLKRMTRNDEEAADFVLPKLKKKGRRDFDENSDLEIPVEEMDEKLKKAKQAKKAKRRKAQSNGNKNESIMEVDGEDEVRNVKISDWD